MLQYFQHYTVVTATPQHVLRSSRSVILSNDAFREPLHRPLPGYNWDNGQALSESAGKEGEAAVLSGEQATGPWIVSDCSLNSDCWWGFGVSGAQRHMTSLGVFLIWNFVSGCHFFSKSCNNYPWCLHTKLMWMQKVSTGWLMYFCDCLHHHYCFHLLLS